MAHWRTSGKPKSEKLCQWCGDRIIYNSESNYCDAICYMKWHKLQCETKKIGKMIKVNEKTWVELKVGETEEQAIQRMNKKLGNSLTLEGMAASKQQPLGYRSKGFK